MHCDQAKIHQSVNEETKIKGNNQNLYISENKNG